MFKFKKKKVEKVEKVAIENKPLRTIDILAQHILDNPTLLRYCENQLYFNGQALQVVYTFNNDRIILFGYTLINLELTRLFKKIIFENNEDELRNKFNLWMCEGCGEIIGANKIKHAICNKTLQN